MLDTARGCPAEGVAVSLERQPPGSCGVWEPVGAAITNADGRVPDLLPPSPTIEPGVYRRAAPAWHVGPLCCLPCPALLCRRPIFPA